MDKNLKFWPLNFRWLTCQQGIKIVEVYYFHRDPWVQNHKEKCETNLFLLKKSLKYHIFWILGISKFYISKEILECYWAFRLAKHELRVEQIWQKNYHFTAKLDQITIRYLCCINWSFS